MSGPAGSAIPIFLRALVCWDSLGGQHVGPQEPFAGEGLPGLQGSAGGRARPRHVLWALPPEGARAHPRHCPTPGRVDPASGAVHAPSVSRDPRPRAPRALSPPDGRARWLPLPLPLAAAAGIVFVVAEAGRAAGAGSLSPGRAPPPPLAQRPRLRGAPIAPIFRRSSVTRRRRRRRRGPEREAPGTAARRPPPPPWRRWDPVRRTLGLGPGPDPGTGGRAAGWQLPVAPIGLCVPGLGRQAWGRETPLHKAEGADPGLGGGGFRAPAWRAEPVLDV